MKSFSIILFVVLITTTLGCTESETINEFTIDGIYKGSVINDALYKSSSSKSDFTAEVTIANDMVQVHCYGNQLDIHFTMDYFKHNDSIMLCLTSEEYENLYGHSHSGRHGSHHSGSGETEWEMHHTQYHSEQGNDHSGSFDKHHGTLTCSFMWQDQKHTFNGIRQ